MNKLKWIVLIAIVVIIVLSVVVFVSMRFNAGFRVDLTVSGIRDIKIGNVPLMGIREADEIDIKNYERNYKMKEADIRDMFRNPSGYACIQYFITYQSNKQTPNDESKLLGVFYKAEYDNELSIMYVGNDLRRDMELTYTKDKYYDNSVLVYVKRNGKSNEEILELAREVNFKIIGLESYTEQNMINF